MKHIIVIETMDTPIDEHDAQKFQKQCYEIVGMIAEYYYGSCFVRSAFHAESAIRAVAGMYNVVYEPKTGEFE